MVGVTLVLRCLLGDVELGRAEFADRCSSVAVVVVYS